MCIPVMYNVYKASSSLYRTIPPPILQSIPSVLYNTKVIKSV